MDNSQTSTDIQLFNYSEGDTILKGFLIITLVLLAYVGIMAFYVKKFINYYYPVFVLSFITFTFLFDNYKVEQFGFYSISIMISFAYCIYLYFYLSKKDYSK
tara:strand:- start:785 stop:1090 length:306 start_codon:yes stop_codon:yes gene_type:complete